MYYRRTLRQAHYFDNNSKYRYSGGLGADFPFICSLSGLIPLSTVSQQIQVATGILGPLPLPPSAVDGGGGTEKRKRKVQIQRLRKCRHVCENVCAPRTVCEHWLAAMDKQKSTTHGHNKGKQTGSEEGHNGTRKHESNLFVGSFLSRAVSPLSFPYFLTQ